MTEHRIALRRRDQRLRALGELLGEALATPAAYEMAPAQRIELYRIVGGGALLTSRADWTRDVLRSAVVCGLVARSGQDDGPAQLRERLLDDSRR